MTYTTVGGAPSPTKGVFRSSQKIRVLYITPSADLYGSDVCLLEMVKRLDKKRFLPYVVLPYKGDLFTELSKIEGIKIEILDLAVMRIKYMHPLRFFIFVWKFLFSSLKLYQLVKKNRIDIIHSNSSMLQVGGTAAFFAGKPHIWHVREITLRPKILNLFLSVILSKLSTRILCITKAVQDSFISLDGFKDKAGVLYDCLDLTGLLKKPFYGEVLCRDRASPCLNSKQDSHTIRRAHRSEGSTLLTLPERSRREQSRRKGCSYDNLFSLIKPHKAPFQRSLPPYSAIRNSQTLKKELGIEDGFQVIGTVGRINFTKGHKVLLEAAEKVLQNHPQTVFLIVGGADERFGHHQVLEELKNFVKRLNIEKNVMFPGFRKDVWETISLLDIFVLPSIKPEGLGLSLVQAMALGKPVIATAQGGPLEIIENDKTGILIPSNDSIILADALVSLLKDPQKSQQIGKAGQRMVSRRFDFEKSGYMEKLEVLYYEVLKEERKDV
jgi:glycosyltransferase involved in cell wall biosynthesis